MKGVVAKLVHLQDPTTTTALEVAAGGKLYQVTIPSRLYITLLLSSVVVASSVAAQQQAKATLMATLPVQKGMHAVLQEGAMLSMCWTSVLHEFHYCMGSWTMITELIPSFLWYCHWTRTEERLLYGRHTSVRRGSVV